MEDDGYNDAVDDRGWWLTAASTWSTVGSELMVADKCFQMAHNASRCKFQIHESWGIGRRRRWWRESTEQLMAKSEGAAAAAPARGRCGPLRP